MDAHVFATEVVTDPTRRILQGNARDLHVFAVDEPHHEGASVLLEAIVAAAAVDDSFAGDGCADGILGIDQATVALLADGVGESTRDLGVIGDIAAALEDTAVFEVKRDARAEENCPDAVEAGTDANGAAAARGHGIDGLLDPTGLQFHQFGGFVRGKGDSHKLVVKPRGVMQDPVSLNRKPATGESCGRLRQQ